MGDAGDADCTLAEGILDCRNNTSTEPGFKNASAEPESTEPSVPFVWPIAADGEFVWPIRGVGELTDIGDDTFHGLGATCQLDKPDDHHQGQLKIAELENAGPGK